MSDHFDRARRRAMECLNCRNRVPCREQHWAYVPVPDGGCMNFEPTLRPHSIKRYSLNKVSRMGLDIDVFQKLSKVDNPVLDENGCPENWESEWRPGGGMEWSEEHWPGRGEGIDVDTTYRFEKQFNFRAGSYSGYNWWREQLKAMREYPSFEEQINFADNEGVIGPIVSAKLARDYKENLMKAEAYSNSLDDGIWWIQQYRNWMKAFDMAADGGAVSFG